MKVAEPDMARSGLGTVHSVGKYSCVFVPLRDGRHAGAVYLRRHVDRSAGADPSRKGRMLFVANVHPTATEDGLAAMFADYGGVADVDVQQPEDAPAGGHAIVTFRSAATVDRVLRGERPLFPPELPEENAKGARSAAPRGAAGGEHGFRGAARRCLAAAPGSWRVGGRCSTVGRGILRLTRPDGPARSLASRVPGGAGLCGEAAGGGRCIYAAIRR